MFSESELAFVFIVTLGCFMLERRRTDGPPVRRPNKKKRKRVKCYNCCLFKRSDQRSGPQRKTMTTKLLTTVAHCSGRMFKVVRRCRFNIIFLAVIELLTSFSFTKFYFFTAITLINWSIKRCRQQQVNKNLELKQLTKYRKD